VRWQSSVSHDPSKIRLIWGFGAHFLENRLKIVHFIVILINLMHPWWIWVFISLKWKKPTAHKLLNSSVSYIDYSYKSFYSVFASFLKSQFTFSEIAWKRETSSIPQNFSFCVKQKKKSNKLRTTWWLTFFGWANPLNILYLHSHSEVIIIKT